MKKQAATLESLQTNMNSMQTNMESMQKNMEKGFDKIAKTLDGMQSNFKRIDSTLDNIQINLSDTQENVHFLVKNAVMRDELQPILDHVITQSESRMISHMEGFIRRHITMEEEVLIHGHKIGVIEKVLGLPNAA
jgi:hypothetical protein